VEETQRKSRASARSMKACQVGMDLDALGKRWTYHILRDIGVLNIDRFNQILRSIPGLTPRVLIMRLNELEDRGLITSMVIQQRPRLVRWVLTEKGIDAMPIFEGYQAFLNKWHPNADLKNHRRPPIKAPSIYELIEVQREAATGQSA
jgi:DNA-binding HxlR family transcriptional regulator